MEYEKLVDKKEIEIGGRVFAISKIPAVFAIPIYSSVHDVIISNGVIGIAKLPLGTVKDILQFVSVNINNRWEGFSTDTAINNCFTNYADIVHVMSEMVKYNFDFFVGGDLQSLYAGLLPAEEETE